MFALVNQKSRSQNLHHYSNSCKNVIKCVLGHTSNDVDQNNLCLKEGYTNWIKQGYYLKLACPSP